MFLNYLSDRDYEEKYWSFIFRFETLIQGITFEIAKRANLLNDEQIADCFTTAFSRIFDVSSGCVPPDWWDGLEAPSMDWFLQYSAVELPYMVKETKRLASLKQLDSELSEGSQIDKEKVKRYAHISKPFQDFLMSRVQRDR